MSLAEPRDGADVLAALADGLRAWIERTALAERRLTTFAFREDGPAVEVEATTGRRYFIGRALGATADPATIRLLELTRDDGVPVADLLIRDDLGVEPGDRIALAERIAVAASTGLVGRELELDRVSCTPLGAAVVDLVTSLEARLETADPRPTGPSGSGEPPAPRTADP